MISRVKAAGRAEAWEVNRGHWGAAISAAGFHAKLVDAGSRHCRLMIPGHGWFDYWPSTERWSQSRRPGDKQGLSGAGLEALIIAARTVRGH